MRCGFCGYDFDPADGQRACESCPLSSGCGLVRCPRCGYDNPREATLIRLARRLRGRRRSTLAKEISR